MNYHRKRPGNGRKEQDRMNLVYIHTHDSGRYWQPYGAPVCMPETMRFAEEGLLFRNAFTAAPTCSPSRAAMLTGRAAHSSGMLGLAHRGFSLADPEMHLSAFLRRNGFETVLAGVQHEAADDKDLSYERIISDPVLKNSPEADLVNAGRAAAYLREAHERPFFLSFGMFSTHRPYPDHRAYGIDPESVKPPFPAADNEATRADMADYTSSALIADRSAGIVLDALKESGAYDDTVVLMTTDHGLAWPRMKCTLYDTGIGVALILRVPGMKRAGQQTDRLVSQVDLFPTICDLLGLEKPAGLQGVSLLPVIEEDRPVRDAVFAEVNYHAAYQPMRCVRTERYKLIRRYGEAEKIVWPNIDDSPAKEQLYAAVKENGTGEDGPVAAPVEEFYDLLKDPEEQEDRISDPAYAEDIASLRAGMKHWMKETEDPLLLNGGIVPRPAGAVVNRKSCYSPTEKDYEA